MSNLTITTDENVLKKARMRALSEGTSVNAVLREFLESYAGMRRDRMTAIEHILSISRTCESRRGEKAWSREDLYER